MELLASGIVDLGLTVRETLSLTPRHLHFLGERFTAREERETRRFCFLVASVHNMFTSEPENHITADDLMNGKPHDDVKEWAEAQVLKFERFNQKTIEAGAQPIIRKWVPNG